MKDLFGNEVKSEYTKFVEKFKPKLTTDDCYTPTAVYDWIKSYVVEQCKVSNTTRIMRPFRPNGDYQAEDYSGDCIVIDNPPFSIISKICRFYDEKKVQYFLFAPHLTLFGIVAAPTKIVAGCSIIYENGANVKTSFVSNMFGDIAILADPAYNKAIKEIQRLNKPKLPKYVYPPNVVTVSRLSKIVERGHGVKFLKSELSYISTMDSQRKKKTGIFGGGFLISKLKAEELKAEELKVEWALSDKELIVIERLGGGINKQGLFNI